jgi:hypothetical protein
VVLTLYDAPLTIAQNELQGKNFFPYEMALSKVLICLCVVLCAEEERISCRGQKPIVLK